MKERKTYEVTLTSRQKSTLDKLLEVVWDDDCVELREIKQDDETVEEELKYVFPEEGDEYWFIDNDGDIDLNYFDPNRNMSDAGRIVLGNYFRTREEAEFEAERLKVIAEMKKFAEPKDREWDGNAPHYSICYHNSVGNVWISAHYGCKYDIIYFSSYDIARKCIDTVGEDRIKKYYLRIDN